MRCLVAVGVAVVVVLVLAGRARADELPATPSGDNGPDPTWALVGGVATSLVPLAVGGGIMALSSREQDRRRRTGLDLMVSGFALAPIVAELSVREWRRAAIFGAVSLVFGGIAIGTVEWHDGAINLASIQAKNIYGLSVTATVVIAAAGVIDGMLAGRRWRERRQRTLKQHATALVLPTANASGGGLAVGGTW